MSAQLLNKASSKNAEAIILLRYGLPKQNRPFWYKTDDLQCMLKQGGLPTLPDSLVLKALKSKLQIKDGIEMNNYRKKNWYCFDYGRDKIPYDTARMQVCSLEGLNDDEKEEIIPAIPYNYFHSFKLNHLKEYTKATTDPPSNPSTSTPKAYINSPTGSNSNPSPSANTFSFHLNSANRCCHQPSNTNTPAPPSTSHHSPQRNNKDVSNPPSNPSTCTPTACQSTKNMRAINPTRNGCTNKSATAKVSPSSSTSAEEEIERQDVILLQRLQSLNIAIKEISGDGASPF